MKTPLMKTRGNLTSEESIMIVAGVSEGGEESKAAKEEKQNEPTRKPRANISMFVILTPIATPMSRGTIESEAPKTTEANMSPKIIEAIEIGAETSRSRVFILVSQGGITGTTEEAVKNILIPSIPGIKKFGGISRPIQKAKNRNRGKRTPKITTGPLK